MSEYIIKTYNESFIEEQVEIGTLFSRKWLAFTQTKAEQLSQIYSRDNFDLDTRLYCFKDEEMVGFIGANIVNDKKENIKRANTRLAFVRSGHEEVFFILYNKLEGILKEKGVSVITTPQSKLNDNYYELAEKLGFSFSRSFAEIYVGQTSSFLRLETDLHISDFNWETDYDHTLNKLKEVYENSTEEALVDYLNITKKIHKPISFKVIRDGDSIVAFCRARVSSTDEFAQIDLLLGENLDYKRQLISDVISICRDKGFRKIAIILGGGAVEGLKESILLKEMGFEKAASIDTLIKRI